MRKARGYVLFLFRQEKNEKKPTKGALRANSAPFGIPRRPIVSAWGNRTSLYPGFAAAYTVPPPVLTVIGAFLPPGKKAARRLLR